MAVPFMAGAAALIGLLFIAGVLTCDSMRFHPDMGLLPQAPVLQYIRDRSDPLKRLLQRKSCAKHGMIQDEHKLTNKIRQALSAHLRRLMRFLEMK